MCAYSAIDMAMAWVAACAFSTARRTTGVIVAGILATVVAGHLANQTKAARNGKIRRCVACDKRFRDSAKHNCGSLNHNQVVGRDEGRGSRVQMTRD